MSFLASEQDNGCSHQRQRDPEGGEHTGELLTGCPFASPQHTGLERYHSPRKAPTSHTGDTWAPRAPADNVPRGVKPCGDPSPGHRLRLSCYKQLHGNLCCGHSHFLQLLSTGSPHGFAGVPLFSRDGQSTRKGCGKWSCSFPHTLPPRTTASSPPGRDEIWSKRCRQRGLFETALPINNSWERSGESQGSQRRDL